MEIINIVKEYSPVVTLVLITISLIIVYFKKYFEKIGEIQAVSDNIKILQKELKENTEIIETIKHEYSKNLEDYKKEIELLNFKLKLKGSDEYNLAKKIALNLLNIRYNFPYIKPGFEGISDEEILQHFEIKEDKSVFTSYDLYYFRTLFLMKEIHKQIVDLNINSFEAEMYWEENENNLIKKILLKYEDFRRNLEIYRYSGNRVYEINRMINVDQELEEHFKEEHKGHMSEIKKSLLFLRQDSDVQLEFLNDINSCLEMLKKKIKINFK